ncbi:hypothetical protein [uncultured Shewanella sp.]|uniref:hypothetical protein n=1 Tax=uncultured Shewanella sp. TaxID=173975 RepID=UPI00260B872C|nr:hypothetical protein [uncultured Shewanella sp.]
MLKWMPYCLIIVYLGLLFWPSVLVYNDGSPASVSYHPHHSLVSFFVRDHAQFIKQPNDISFIPQHSEDAPSQLSNVQISLFVVLLQDSTPAKLEPVNEYMLAPTVFFRVQNIIYTTSLNALMWVAKTIILHDIDHPPIFHLSHVINN